MYLLQHVKRITYIIFERQLEGMYYVSTSSLSDLMFPLFHDSTCSIVSGSGRHLVSGRNIVMTPANIDNRPINTGTSPGIWRS